MSENTSKLPNPTVSMGHLEDLGGMTRPEMFQYGKINFEVDLPKTAKDEVLRSKLTKLITDYVEANKPKEEAPKPVLAKKEVKGLKKVLNIKTGVELFLTPGIEKVMKKDPSNFELIY